MKNKMVYFWPFFLISALLLVNCAGNKQEQGRPAPVTENNLEKGGLEIAVPSVIGLPYQEAASKLSEMQFQTSRNDVPNDSVAPGIVINTEPAAGQTVPIGSEIQVRVSQSLELVAVPFLIGRSLQEASQSLQQTGLVPDIQAESDRVVEQDPVAGTQLEKGSKVRLY